MGLVSRFRMIFSAKANRVADRMENPEETLDLAYNKQLQALQKVRSGIADVVTAQKRLEIQQREMVANRKKLDDVARRALTQGRDDLAVSALTQSELFDSQMASLQQQIDALAQQRDSLEKAGEQLQARVTTMRTQKETLKAQYRANRATVVAGEAATGLSQDTAEIDMMLERARDRMLQTQARAETVNELMESGSLARLSASPQSVEATVMAQATADSVDLRLTEMRRQLGIAAPPPLALGETAVEPKNETDSAPRPTAQ